MAGKSTTTGGPILNNCAMGDVQQGLRLVSQHLRISCSLGTRLPTVAVLGATGAVGRELILLLEQRGISLWTA